jgi:hypothetical protein
MGAATSAGPLLSFRGLVDGAVADVTVHPDHLAWEVRPGLFARWVRETRVVPLRIVSSVTTRRANLLWSRVRLTAMGSVIEFQVGHDLAARIRDLVVPLVVAGPGTAAAPVALAPVAGDEPGLPPAGWYPDPAGAAAWRWWDGRSWTWHTHAPPRAG